MAAGARRCCSALPDHRASIERRCRSCDLSGGGQLRDKTSSTGKQRCPSKTDLTSPPALETRRSVPGVRRPVLRPMQSGRHLSRAAVAKSPSFRSSCSCCWLLAWPSLPGANCRRRGRGNSGRIYFSSSLTASLVEPAPAVFNAHAVLAVSGKIGPAAATWFRGKLDEFRLRAGDVVAFASPGGSVDQAIIIGEILRSRGLKVAVATFDGEGGMRPADCASACVLAYAGGTVRFGVPGRHSVFTGSRRKAQAVIRSQRLNGCPD